MKSQGFAFDTQFAALACERELLASLVAFYGAQDAPVVVDAPILGPDEATLEAVLADTAQIQPEYSPAPEVIDQVAPPAAQDDWPVVPCAGCGKARRARSRTPSRIRELVDHPFCKACSNANRAKARREAKAADEPAPEPEPEPLAPASGARTCSNCGAELKQCNRSGLCRVCNGQRGRHVGSSLDHPARLTCPDCGADRGPWNARYAGGRCAACAGIARRKPREITLCQDCGTTITPGCKRCQPCLKKSGFHSSTSRGPCTACGQTHGLRGGLCATCRMAGHSKATVAQAAASEWTVHARPVVVREDEIVGDGTGGLKVGQTYRRTVLAPPAVVPGDDDDDDDPVHMALRDGGGRMI